MKSGLLGFLVAMLVVALGYSIPTTMSLVKRPVPVINTEVTVTPEDNGAADENSGQPVQTLQRTNLCI
jgi:hypothetical protein